MTYNAVKDYAKCYPAYIHRADIDDLLDAGKIYIRMTTGKWWQIRRNGKTKTWKRDATRFAIPFKAGMYEFGTIDNSFLQLGGVLPPQHFRQDIDLM